MSTQTFARRVLIVLGLGTLALILAVALWRASDIFLLAFAGLLLGVLFRTLSNLLERYARLPGGWSLAAAVGLLFVLLGLVGLLIGPRLAGQVDTLLTSLPTSVSGLESQLSRYGWGERLLEQVPVEGALPTSGLFSRLTGTLSTLWTVVLHIIFVFFLAIFFASEPGLYRGGLLRLVPPARRERAGEVVGELYVTLQAWLVGKIVSMTVVGLLIGLGLWLLGMPLALTLGVLAGGLEFIPFFGPFLASVPAILLALTESPLQAVYVALLYVVVQQIEGNIILPLVHKRTVDLPPALTLVSVLALGAIFGFVGLLVATPIMAVVLVLVKMLYVEDVLGEHTKLPQSPVEAVMSD